MVMLRALILGGLLPPSASALIVNRLSPDGERGPRSQALKALKAMGVPVFVWDDGAGALASADIIIDGIAGTGLRGALSGAALEMVRAVNGLKERDRGKPLVVAVDVPSGISDSWEPGMPVLRADISLGIEPLKAALYVPALRPWAGTIVPVGELFPPALIDSLV
jgi:NAD(P)H-hydrate epimerase